MRSGSGVAVRVGGQALVDGVLMRSPRAWAVARLDGTVETGPVTPSRWHRVPVLRVVTSLLPALGLGLRAMTGRRGAGPTTDGLGECGDGIPALTQNVGRARRKGLVVVLLLLAATVLMPLLPASPSPLEAIAVAVATLAGLRLLAPRALWRFHGSEHKAVAAYEAGFDPDDVAAALATSRVHDRCGTNLVALLVVPLALLGHLPDTVQVVAAVGLLGVAAEVLTLSARFPSSLATRLLLAPGLLLQRTVTTAEPTLAEQTVACRALAACLTEHGRVAGLAPAAETR